MPTPIILTKTGLHAEQSTVDYTGLLAGGKFIAFDAKETKVKTRLDLKNIQGHQIEYLKMVKSLGGLTFFSVWFYELDEKEAYIVPLSIIEEAIDSGKKSIPYSEIKEGSILTPIEDYLSFIKNERFKELFDPE